MIHRLRSDHLMRPGQRVERNHGPRSADARFEIEERQRRGIRLKLRRELEEDLVLVHRRVDRRHPPRTVRVVESVLDRVRGHPERGRLVAIDLHVDLRARDRQIRRQVLDAVDGREPLLQAARHRVQLVAVGRLHRELVQALAHLTADADRRRVLQIHLHARNPRELRAQRLDDLVGQLAPVAARLEMHDELAEVRAAQRRRRVAADGRHQRLDVLVAPNHVGDLSLVLDELVVRRALRRFRDHRDLIGVLIGDEAFRHQDEEDRRRQQHHRERRHGRLPVLQHDLQRPIVGANQPLEVPLGHLGEARAAVAGLLEKAAAQHRRQCHRHDTRDQDRDADGHRELAEQPAEHAAHEQHRDEHRGERQRHGHDREADLARPDERRRERLLAHLDVPVDVLEHDDRIVDDEADRENQGHHRQVVEAVPEQVHDGEGPDDREGQREARNDRRPHVSQEDEDHHDDEAERQEHRELDVAVRLADRLRAVVEHVHVDARRQLGAELRHEPLDGVGDFDRVGAGLALDAERDGTLVRVAVVEPGRGSLVLDAVDNRSELLEADRRAVAVGHDHRLVLLGVHQLAGRLQRERLVRTDDRAGRDVDVPVPERRFHLVDPDLPRRERVRIELRVHGVLLAAEHLHLRDAAHLRNPLSDARFGVLVQRPRRQGRRRDNEVENRLIGRVDFGKGRRRGHSLRQQPGRLGDGALHVDRGPVEAPVQIELQRDLRRAERVHRGHRLEARDRRELILERRRHRRAHRFRVGAWKLRRDEQRREVDVRQVADGQRPVRDRAEQRDRRHEQAGGNRPINESFGDIHVSVLAGPHHRSLSLGGPASPGYPPALGSGRRRSIFRVLNIDAMYV